MHSLLQSSQLSVRTTDFPRRLDGILLQGRGGMSPPEISSNMRFTEYIFHPYRTGSGFELFVEDLTSLTLNLGSHTTQLVAAIGLSVNYEPFRYAFEFNNRTSLLTLFLKELECFTGCQ